MILIDYGTYHPSPILTNFGKLKFTRDPVLSVTGLAVDPLKPLCRSRSRKQRVWRSKTKVHKSVRVLLLKTNNFHTTKRLFSSGKLVDSVYDALLLYWLVTGHKHSFRTSFRHTSVTDANRSGFCSSLVTFASATDNRGNVLQTSESC